MPRKRQDVLHRKQQAGGARHEGAPALAGFFLAAWHSAASALFSLPSQTQHRFRSHLCGCPGIGINLGVVALAFAIDHSLIPVFPGSDVVREAGVMGGVPHSDQLQTPAFWSEHLLQAVNTVDAEVLCLFGGVSGREGVVARKRLRDSCVGEKGAAERSGLHLGTGALIDPTIEAVACHGGCRRTHERTTGMLAGLLQNGRVSCLIARRGGVRIRGRGGWTCRNLRRVGRGWHFLCGRRLFDGRSVFPRVYGQLVLFTHARVLRAFSTEGASMG